MKHLLFRLMFFHFLSSINDSNSSWIPFFSVLSSWSYSLLTFVIGKYSSLWLTNSGSSCLCFDHAKINIPWSSLRSCSATSFSFCRRCSSVSRRRSSAVSFSCKRPKFQILTYFLIIPSLQMLWIWYEEIRRDSSSKSS